MKDFFISYNQADVHWAEWIAWQIESTGLSTVLQSWDFRPGSNFALEMHMAAQEAERTIAVLSPSYLKSPFTLSEWAAAFAVDPTGSHHKLLPVRVRECDPKGILQQIVYIDLVGMSEENAKKSLLAGIDRNRRKPLISPTFPASPTLETEASPSVTRDRSAPIRLLHLSDLHLGQDRNEVFQRSAYVSLAESLIKDGHIDFVLVTGDLTFRGDLKGFDSARVVLAELLERLDISAENRCFVVPGNHDVQWSEIGPADGLILGKLDSEETVAKVLSHSQTMSLLGARLASFYQFTELMFGRSRAWRSQRPWRVDKVDMAGSLVAVIQLNSAWSLGPPSSSVPILGEFQVRDALTAAADCTMRFWLVHHPLSALENRERDRIARILSETDGIDLVFCGAAHGSNSAMVQHESFIEVSAGWNVRGSSSSVLPDFFCNVIEIDQSSGTLKVIPLQFLHNQSGWVRPPLDGKAMQLPGPQVVRQKMALPTMSAKAESRDASVVEAIRSRNVDAIATIKTLSGELFKKEVLPRPILIITATEVELRAALSYMQPKKRKRAICRGHIGHETYYLGRFGAQDAILTMCGTGAMGRDSVILATQEAVSLFSPKGIVMVGIAFGGNKNKQSLGDVLVASQVISYEQQRVGEKQVIQRGIIVETGPTLLNRIRQSLDWEFVTPDGQQAKIIIGPILSGEKLVDNASYKESLFNSFPQAIGGEMEGAGLYAAAARSGVEWIVVKGICDWADGTKTDNAQSLAAASAASLVHHVLSDSSVLESM